MQLVHGHAGPALVQAHMRAVQRALPRDDHVHAGGRLALPEQLYALMDSRGGKQHGQGMSERGCKFVR